MRPRPSPSALFLRALTGADVGIAGPLRAYADLQFTTMGHSHLRMSAGVRVVALTRPAAADAARRAAKAHQIAVSPEDAAGKDVRVSLASGAQRKGKLVSLSSTEVSLREGSQDTRYPLDQVLLVETVHHTARKAAIGGAIAGFIGGYLASCGGGDEEDCWPEVGAMVGGMAAGGGAIIGALIDRAAADKHVVYAASTRSVRVVPTITPTRAGVSLAMRW